MHPETEPASETAENSKGIRAPQDSSELGSPVQSKAQGNESQKTGAHDPARYKLENSNGLTITVLNNGLIESIDVAPIRLSLNAASPLGRLGTNLYLRKTGSPFDYKLLLGPESDSLFTVSNNTLVVKGSWDDLDYVCELQLSDESHSWQWSVELCNTSDSAVQLDLIYIQDAGLVPANGGRSNEYYISQYLERRILQDDAFGPVILCRQNLKGPTGNPYLMIVSKNSAAAASVDGMQFYGSKFRTSGIPDGVLATDLAGEYCGELSILALQESPFCLAARSTHRSDFLATYLADHQQATSVKDLKRLPSLMQEFRRDKIAEIKSDFRAPEKNLFCTSSILDSEELTDADLDHFFGTNKRHIEKHNGQLLSFFYGKYNHVVLRAKEAIVDRPHAHMMQAKAGCVPDENIMTTTSYMYGVFNSHISQGNTNFNRLLSVCSSQFNLEPHTGQRIFVELDGQQYLLGVPSAFEIGLNYCRWIYEHAGRCFQVRTWTSKLAPQVNMDFKVLRGGPVGILVTNLFDEDNGWTFTRAENAADRVAKPDPESIIANTFPQAQFTIMMNGDTENYEYVGSEALFEDGKNHDSSFLLVKVRETSTFCMSFVGEVVAKTAAVRFEDADKQYQTDCLSAQASWQELSSELHLHGDQEDFAAIREVLPWYGANALTHFLTPHGLEQVDGGAWGTRDTNQGPIEFLLSMRKFDAARQVLRIIFSNQNTDGGWPQWWMFDSYNTVRADGYHGDIFHWCILALSDYINATGDTGFLDEVMPYYHTDGVGVAEKSPLSEHVDRLINMITASFFPGTSLVPFGGGDWNDSMQPVSHDLAERMISTWTVELNYQAFSAYQAVCAQAGRPDQAAELTVICENIKADFNKYLVKDETVSGHGLLEPDGSISLLLHPSDAKTNIQYRLLPMIRGIISGIFTLKQARHHLALIEEHLKGPDGARLMDRAPKYHGGIQKLFQRAESSPYFGREIGLMYMHAHLRYAESLAISGQADAFVKALRQATPVAYREVVPCGDVRQANCYYSSSDVTFKNRYEAEEKYEDLKAGKITLRGGWRIYSSGPGIYISLVISRLLGLRQSFANTIIDPTIPRNLSGVSVSMKFMGRDVTFAYLVTKTGVGPKLIRVNDVTVEFERQTNQYRLGGALIPTNRLMALLDEKENSVRIELG